MKITPQELLKRILHRRLLAWRSSLETLDAACAAQVLKILAAGNQKIHAAVKKFLPKLLKTNYRQAQIVLWAKELTDPVAGELVDLVSDSWAYSALNSLKAYNDILSFDGKTEKISRVPETVEELKKLAEIRPFQKRSLAQMIDSVFTGGIGGALIQTIDEGMNAGWGYQKIVDKLIKDALPQGKALSENYAITISRSYVQQASVNAQMAAYWNNRDVIKGLKWTAILDNRVCIKCAVLDGTEYLWEDPKPALIAHPRCRCLWMPVIKTYRDLGLDLDDLKEADRNWVLREDGNVDTGGKKILDAGKFGGDYGAWWKTLPKDQQIKSIGEIRTRLIHEGKLRFDQLVDKKTGHIYTLGELGFTEGGKPQPISDKVTVASLDKMLFVRASKVVAENFRREFPAWSKKPEGNLPIAVLPENDAKLIGAKVKVAVISPDTYAKQKDHHPELTIEDYAKAQKVLENGEAFQQTEKKTAYIDKLDGLTMILKATGIGDEIYMVSMYKLSVDPIKRLSQYRTLKKNKK